MIPLAEEELRFLRHPGSSGNRRKGALTNFQNKGESQEIGTR